LRKGDKYSGTPRKGNSKKRVAPKQARMYSRPPRDHEIIDQMMGQFMDTGIVETCEDGGNTQYSKRRKTEKRYFTKIDFTDGYFHIPIKAKYRKLFAFATRRGVFQWI
jgi:hypothetical protein